MEFFKKIHREKRSVWSIEFKNPGAIYENVSESITKYFSICGAKRFEQGYSRMNAKLAFLVVDLMLYLVLSVWCISELWGDMVDVIFCIVTIGVAFQVFFVIVIFLDINFNETFI